MSALEFLAITDDTFSDVGTGQWLLNDTGQGTPLTSGRIDGTAGTATDIRATLRGRAIDICAALSGG